MKKKLLALGVSLGLCLVFLVPEPQAHASDPCGTLADRQSRFAGAGNPASINTYGIRAKIEFRTLNLCDDPDGSNGVTTAWAMLLAEPIVAAGDTGYAQVGYARFGVDSGYTGGTWNFTQYTSLCAEQGTCSGSQLRFATGYWGQPDQALHIYTVARASDGYIYMRIDGDTMTRMGHLPAGSWKPQWQSNYAAEVHQAGDDIVGTTGNRTSFYFLQRQLDTGTWQYYANWAAGLDPFASIPRHHAEEFNPATGLGFLTWTDPL